MNGYLWKCWRDTRSTFLVLLGGVLVVAALGLYAAVDPFGWIAAKPEGVRAVWQSTASALVASTLGLIPVAGFVLGAFGVGMEFEKRTADFLLTRPRSRRYFLWASWAVGALQMVALVLAGHLAQLSRRNPSPFADMSVFLRSLVVGSVIALIFFSVTYLMTTLALNSRNGTSLAVLTVVAYLGLHLWLRLWYQVVIPTPWDSLGRAGRGAETLPIPGVAGWLAVCLVSVLVAQFRLERTEV
jgi:ABC-type transport system involved in multi-copper enzyme maturation permease subunit